MKILTWMALFAALAGPVWAAESGVLRLTPKFLGDLAEEARTNNPRLRAAETRVRAAEQGIRAVRIWEDPELMAGGVTASKAMREEEGDLIYGLEQRVPLNGKAKAEREAMRAEESVARASRDMRFQELRKEIALTAFRAALADEVARVSEEDLGWLRGMVQTAEARYQGTGAGQGDVLRMQTEHALRAEQWRREKMARESEILVLNRLLNRPLAAAWPALALPEPAAQIVFSPKLIAVAARFDPRLKILRRETARAEASAQAARTQRRPDFSVAVEGRQYSGNAEFKEGTFLLKMSLPFVNRQKYGARWRQEQEKARAAEEDAVEYEGKQAEEISRLVIQIENARREFVVYRDEVLPRADQSLRVAEAAWQAGTGMLRDVLEARRMVLEGRTMQARAVAEQYQMMADLVLCCGLGDLESLQMLETLDLNKAEPEGKP